MHKIIILLSAKRCGSTAIFNLFQKHSDVKILNKNQNIINWEPQLWTYAVEAINGTVNDFNYRVNHTLGVEKIFLKNNYKEECIFKLFDIILNKFGPTIFDKSPQYLGSLESMELLMKYKKRRPKVVFIFFSFIRNPLDAITSQFELWSHYTNEKNLKCRELDWLKKYKNLEYLQKKIKIKLYKYEDFCGDPKKFTIDLMHYCKLQFSENLYSHLIIKSVGRYYVTPYKKIKDWKISSEMKSHIRKYGYDFKNRDAISLLQKLKILSSSLKRKLVPTYEKFFKK